MTASESARHWLGRLVLEVESTGERSVLRKTSHTGPLRVQRAFYPETDGTCHVYILHPPGGVVGGDELDVKINVGANARCLVTTPGAAKLYRCDGVGSRLGNEMVVADGARLEWLPQETIAFDGAISHVKTVVELHGRAQYLGWDILCLGRPAADESFSRGRLVFQQLITRDGHPLLAERLLVNGSGDILTQAWGLDGFNVLGTFLVVSDEVRWVDWIRQQLAQTVERDVVWSGSELDGISVFRAIGREATAVRSVLQAIWDGHHSPRIWKL